jgi:hypothetical protein
MEWPFNTDERIIMDGDSMSNFDWSDNRAFRNAKRAYDRLFERGNNGDDSLDDDVMILEPNEIDETY